MYNRIQLMNFKSKKSTFSGSQVESAVEERFLARLDRVGGGGRSVPSENTKDN